MINSILEEFNEVKIFSTYSKDMMQGGIRLDASFYCNKFFSNIFAKTKNALLEEYCESIFNPPVFKREFQINESGGCRYLASSEIISLVPDQVYISKNQANALNLKVKKGWILITGFGTIGSVRIVDKLIDDFAVANNVARLIPKDAEFRSGFIAAYLSSPIGSSLLNERASGSVVRFIEAPQIAKIPIPIIDDNAADLINAKYLTAVNCREEAFRLLREADDLVYSVNNLKRLDENNAINYDFEEDVEASTISSKEIFNFNGAESEFRIDASYYNPMVNLALKNLKSCNFELKLIRDISKRVILIFRFKRSYVDREYGVPFLSGKNITQIRPVNLKYLSKTETQSLEKLFLIKGWILITCSGTLGRACFVWQNYENYAATQHIIRVVPNEEEIDSGYLYAFLSSRYGYEQIIRFRHGSVIDEVTDKQIEKILVPIPEPKEQEIIGNKVRTAYQKRAEAIRLEDEAQEILMKELGLNII
jgi:type I restriction enzyme S subunit